MNISEHYEKFLDYLSAEKNVSKQTITSYKTDLSILLFF